jgi:hypothetical protein
MKEPKEVICPMCGGNRLKVGQVSYNTQVYSPDWEKNGDDEEWSASDYSLDQNRYIVSIYCQDCSENCEDTDLTDLAIEAGWEIYDEDSFKLKTK